MEPPYEVLDVREGAGYEFRKYMAAKWTSTKMVAPTFDESTGTAFRRLFNYITGKNAGDKKVSMTVPVTMAITKEPTDVQMVMSFYVPHEYQENPPQPTGEGVYTESRDEISVYVRRFGGRAKGEDWFRELDNLRKDLEADGISDEDLDLSTFFAVGYDSPFKLFWRRNEVWIKKSD